MNGTAEQLRAGILERLDDPARWHVYADWLEEHGDPTAASVREFARCIESEETPIARYIRLGASASASTDPEHTTFCAKIIQAGEPAVRDAAESLISDAAHDLLDYEAPSIAMATTNAIGWAIDEITIDAMEWTDEGLEVHVNYSAHGEHEEDKMYHGDAIDGTALATISDEENVRFSDVTAEL